MMNMRRTLKDKHKVKYHVYILDFINFEEMEGIGFYLAFYSLGHIAKMYPGTGKKFSSLPE